MSDNIIDTLKKKFGDAVKYLNGGTYCKVYSISDLEVIKVYNNPYIGLSEYIKCHKYSLNNINIVREVMINRTLTHPNIVHCSGPQFDKNIGIYCKMERMNGTIANSYITSQFNIKIFYQLLESMVDALIYIHSHEIIHSDIKPSNIMYKIIEVNGEHQCLFKLIDFNLAQYYKPLPQNNKTYATVNYSKEENKRYMD